MLMQRNNAMKRAGQSNPVLVGVPSALIVRGDKSFRSLLLAGRFPRRKQFHPLDDI